MNDIIQEYLIHLKSKHYSPATIYNYSSEIKKLINWLNKECLTLNISISEIIRYLSNRKKDINLNTLNIVISALKSFFNYLELCNYGNYEFISLLETRKYKQNMPLILSGKEIKKLFKSINTDKIYGVRNRALYGLIYSAGLRVSEAVLLNTCDLFLFRNIAKVLGKGNRERFVIFDDITAYWLNEYLKRIRPLFLKDTKENALFLNKNGKRLTKTCIWKNYSQLAKKTNVSSTKLHTLRHTFATELLKGGASIRTIQMLLGHVNINTTQIYTHLNTKDLRYNHIKYMPKLFKQRQI